ncbi:hypothetical protein SY27_11850 [Flavobacterium sp. 316]|uniref:Uncharacterized protein n=1 Tax=Flavobacterium sediminilitoris TaxID=2024526 RepID=A0ABY4HRL1_9FLAO|nr:MULTISPECIES: hypothetical protein [Flavobacterium]KIX20595.1 hypothetical protein SY27_11850 [Flavobacterium sp. 316]UOX34822.1 hypothetical protein LXD69_04760 [Flavobacterium sediminilitoris]
MTTDYPFKKIQVKVSLKENNDPSAQIVSIEVGYPDSNGNYSWKSSSRLLDNKSLLFLKTKSKSGNEIDSIVPSTWYDISDKSKSFVFDFVKNEIPSKIKIREQIISVKNTNEIKEYDLLETDETFSISNLEITISEKVIGTD